MQHTNEDKKKPKTICSNMQQTKNQNEKHEATLPTCLEKALLFKGNRWEGEIKENNLTRLDAGCT